MFIRIDPSSDTPLWEQVASGVRDEIVSGRLSAGERLPPAKQIGPSLGVNLHTVLRAYQQLRDEGLIDLRRGRGAVVATSMHGIGEIGEAVGALVARARQAQLPVAAVLALVAAAYPPEETS